MEKRERRERYCRNQSVKQRYGGGSRTGLNDSKNSRGDSRNDKEKDNVAGSAMVVEEKKVVDHTAIPDPHMFDHLKRETADIADLTSKKFGGKRQIFSNWAKYELPSEEFDDQQPIGSNFEELLQSAQLGSQPKWDPKGSVQNAAFTIDLGMLEASLACLPLYKKLDLPLDMFTSGELERMEKQVRSGQEVWKHKKTKSTKKEGLEICGSLLEKLTEMPSDKLASELLSSSGNTISSSNARRSAERTPVREQTPNRDEEMSFDFGAIPTRGSSESGLASFRKEKSVEPSIMLRESPAHHKIHAPVEVQQIPAVKSEPEEVAAEEMLVTPSAKEPLVPTFAEEPSASLPTKEPLTFLPAEEPPLPRSPEESQVPPSPTSLEPRTEQKLPTAQAPREGQGRKKSRGSKNKRRSWGQDSEDAHPQAEEAKSRPPANHHIQSTQDAMPVASYENTKGETSTKTGRSEVHHSHVTCTPETDPEQPDSLKTSVPKEKSRRGDRENKSQQPVKRNSPPLRDDVPKEEPQPLAVPKEKSRNTEAKRNPQQQVDAAGAAHTQSRSELLKTSVQSQPVGQDNKRAVDQGKDIPSPRKDDDQLDFLLSLQKPVASQQRMTFATPTTAVRAAIDEDEPVTASSMPPVPEKKTEDLENWLDSMLDD